MKLEDSDIDDIDMDEEYEMVPLEPMMYGYGQMNMIPYMGMTGGYMQDVNSNMRMDSLTEMNPWSGMGQFNDDMYRNEFNQFGRMYGEASMNDYQEENEGLEKLDKYQDTEQVREQYNKPIMPGRPNPQYNEVDSIVRRIERYNPAIFRRLARCGITYAESREIVTKIVRVTLMYRDE